MSKFWGSIEDTQEDLLADGYDEDLKETIKELIKR
jgi:hypothetical protein